jgi:starch-binding outer membrane protein, SusD/RagB family
MKRNINYISMIVAASMLFAACTESFLEKNPKSQNNTESALQTYQDALVALTGAYDGMQTTAYYGRNFIVTGDVASDNVKVSPTNSGRFLTEYSYSSIPSSQNPEDFWTIAYDVINRANMIINNIDVVADASEEEINQILGEAYGIRALVHFDLVRYFAQPYNLTEIAIADNANGQGGHLGIPYMLESVISEPARETVSSNYANIISDLRKSAELINVEPAEPFTFSSGAANALLARAYLYIENWDSAQYFANKVITEYGYTLVSNANYIASWSQDYTSESIFSIKMTPDDYNQTDALGYIFLDAGYGDLSPTQDILDLYDDNDVRGYGKNGDVTSTTNSMFYSVAGQLFINKFPGRESTTGLDNSPVIRLSEMYLTRAEANAHLANYTAAQDDVNTILHRANPSAPDIVTSATALIEDVLLERRIELAFEGHRYFDLIRNKKSIERIDHTLADGTTPYPNFRFCFPIPQAEMDANNNMVQNKGYE